MQESLERLRGEHAATLDQLHQALADLTTAREVRGAKAFACGTVLASSTICCSWRGRGRVSPCVCARGWRVHSWRRVQCGALTRCRLCDRRLTHSRRGKPTARRRQQLQALHMLPAGRWVVLVASHGRYEAVSELFGVVRPLCIFSERGALFKDRCGLG